MNGALVMSRSSSSYCEDRMTVLWVIEQDVFEEEFVGRLTDEVCAQGHDVKVYNYAPNWPLRVGDLKEIGGHPHSVFYGSLNLGQRILKSPDAATLPIVFYRPEQFECVRYYGCFRRWLLNYPYVMIPYSGLADVEYREMLFDLFGSDALFIRPNTGNKVFTGQLLTREDFDEQYRFLGRYGPYPYTLVVASAPRNINIEWRFVVADGCVLTGSQYMVEGHNQCKRYDSGPAFDYAQKVLDTVDYEPDRVWTLDVCSTSEGFHVLEIGSFSCAGLYACDVRPVVEKVSEIVMKERPE